MTENINKLDSLDKIKQAKELLDMGAITQEEFYEIKSKLLKQIKVPSNNTNEEVLDVPNMDVALSNEIKDFDLSDSIADYILGDIDDSQFKEQMIKSMKKIQEKEKEERKQPHIPCPRCGKKIPINARKCKYCNLMINKHILKNAKFEDSYELPNVKAHKQRMKYQQAAIKKKNKAYEEKHKQLMKEKQGLKTCPNCGEEILKNAIRCKYCKTMLKTYFNNKSKQSPTKNQNNADFNNEKNSAQNNPKNKINKNLQKIIEDNLKDVCRIFSISNLGKKFVINKLTSEYTEEEISKKLKIYLNNSLRESPTPKKIDKEELINTKINSIPEEYFKIYFMINKTSFKSKNQFIDHMKKHWTLNDIEKFYNEYKLFLKQGVQEKDFEKILEYDMEETCNIFSIPHSLQKLGNRLIAQKVLNNFTTEEIKDKLDSKFNLSNNTDTTEVTKTIDFNTDNQDEPKEIKNSSPPQSKYYAYKTQTNKFKSQFENKEKNTRELIEKCFPAPQMTNSKFNKIIDECSRVFYLEVENIMIILESKNEYSDKLENEIKSDIEILKEMNNKLDSLHDELLILQSDEDDAEVEILLEDLDILIKSVKDYDI